MVVGHLADRLAEHGDVGGTEIAMSTSPTMGMAFSGSSTAAAMRIVARIGASAKIDSSPMRPIPSSSITETIEGLFGPPNSCG